MATTKASPQAPIVAVRDSGELFDNQRNSNTSIDLDLKNVEYTTTEFLTSSNRHIEQIVANHSALVDGLKEGGLAYVESAQGTAWLPYTVGGTYYPKGWYIWDGIEWLSSKSNVAQALDAVEGASSFSGDYNDLTNLPTIPTVFSGDYNDLTNQPTIPTQITDVEIAALGYVKTDNDTQLTDADITALGYIKTQFSGEYADLLNAPTLQNLINVSELVNDSNYATRTEAINYAKGAALALEQNTKAANGAVAQTILVVGPTTNGKVSIVSLTTGNAIRVYEDGADYAAGIIKHLEFMDLGEPMVFENLSSGAVVTSDGGCYGFSENVQGTTFRSPMPLLSLGLAFTDTVVYGFRNSIQGQGFICIANGALDTNITITQGAADTVVLGQENIAMDAWEYRVFDMDGEGEYRVKSDNLVMGGVYANNTNYKDMRLIMPLSNDSITHPKSGYISSLYQNIPFDFYEREGSEGSSTVSLGSPVSLNTLVNAEPGYRPDGCTRILSKGLTNWFSGADAAGNEATPALAVTAMTQRVAQPFFIQDSGNSAQSSVSISSPYEGTAKIYQWNLTTEQAELAYTIPLTRTNVTVTTPEDQYHPCSGLLSNTSVSGNVTLVGQLNAGYVEADVPIMVVSQNTTVTLAPTIRSVDGTTASYGRCENDETLQLGFTPKEIKIQLSTDANSLIRKRVVDASGVVSYALV